MPPVQWKLATCYDTVEPVMVVTHTNTIVNMPGTGSTMSKTLRFSSTIDSIYKSLVKSNSTYIALHNNATFIVLDGKEVSDDGRDRVINLEEYVKHSQGSYAM